VPSAGVNRYACNFHAARSVGGWYLGGELAGVGGFALWELTTAQGVDERDRSLGCAHRSSRAMPFEVNALGGPFYVPSPDTRPQTPFEQHMAK
jgi:hypothetical protein